MARPLPTSSQPGRWGARLPITPPPIPPSPWAPGVTVGPGDRVYIDYGEVGEPWHEMMLLAYVGAADW
eukprot:14332440-Heterocapsa_arctica.AAC.1